jgi:sorting nexin-29
MAGYEVYTRVIAGRLNTIIDAIIADSQNGFRKGRSCTDSVFTLKMLIDKRHEYNFETLIAFVDYEKAFDRVNRQKLWEILPRNRTPMHIVQVINSLYKETLICVDIGNKVGNKRMTTNQGVRQGCSLSTALFNIYLNEMLDEWSRQVSPGIRISKSIYIKTVLFADDEAVIAGTEAELQYSIYELNQIVEKYNFKISSTKTEVMAFKGKRPVRSKIIINGNILKYKISITWVTIYIKTMTEMYNQN